MKPRTLTIYRVLTLVGALLIAVALGLGIALVDMNRTATSTSPSPGRPASYDEDGLQQVDWGYWKSVNPDIVAWIFIPGTNVDAPVVQAKPDDPTYYLTHDVRRHWNVYGAIYLDAACTQGMDSPNLVVFGHHMNDGSMFSQVAEYSSKEFALEHRSIVIQTPAWSRVFHCEGCAVVSGDEQSKRTEFSSQEDFGLYRSKRLAACGMRLDGGAAKQVEQMLTLVTCSYHHSDNERSIVYAS